MLNMMAMFIIGKAIMYKVPHAVQTCEFAEQTIGLPLTVIMTDEARAKGHPWGKMCWWF